MTDKIEEAMREFSEYYDSLIKKIEVEDGHDNQTYVRLNNTVLRIFNAKKYGCTLHLKDEQKLDEGYYKQTWKIIGAHSIETFVLFVNLKDKYVCLNTNRIAPADEPKVEETTALPVITNYERLKALSVQELAEELISTIQTKDASDIPHRRYIVLSGEVCSSLSDAIKKNLEWLNDEAV